MKYVHGFLSRALHTQARKPPFHLLALGASQHILTVYNVYKVNGSRLEVWNQYERPDLYTARRFGTSTPQDDNLLRYVIASVVGTESKKAHASKAVEGWK